MFLFWRNVYAILLAPDVIAPRWRSFVFTLAEINKCAASYYTHRRYALGSKVTAIPAGLMSV